MIRCDCQVSERAERLIELARIPRRYEHCAFENFDVRKDRTSGQPNPYLQKAKIDATRFVEEYPLHDFGLLFVGPTGAGKTHLAVTVLRELMIRKGVECMFCDFRELLQKIRDSYNPVSQSTEYGVVRPLLDVEVLLLDEMASANPTDWVKETLSHLINSRYNQKRVTLITTTLPFGETSGQSSRYGKSEAGEFRMPSGAALPDVEPTLNQFGVTLRSRLYEMCKLVEMYSEDYRKTVRQSGYKFDLEYPPRI